LNFGLGVHDERTAEGDRLAQGWTREEEKSNGGKWA
jgi:hypothetical protein